jgi:hypothetical protein
MNRVGCSRTVSGSRLAASCLVAVLLASPRTVSAQIKVQTFPNLEKSVKERWIGKPESAVIEKLGPPKDKNSTDKSDFLTWQNSVFFGANAKESIDCTAKLRFDSAKLADASVEGSDQNLCLKLLFPLLGDADKRR